MNIGIIVYSRSGHTSSVAKKLEQRLSTDGRTATLKELEIVGPVDMSATTAPLKTVPASDAYDILVLGSPVNGGRMSAAMNSYLQQVPSLDDRKVFLLLTHFFPRGWGANQTIEQMEGVCESKGATICGWESVRWTSLRRRRQISRVVDSLSDRITSTAAQRR